MAELPLSNAQWTEGAWRCSRSSHEGYERFTAQLVDSCSTKEDWTMLGRIAARAGVPDTCPVPATFDTDPEAMHVWEWRR